MVNNFFFGLILNMPHFLLRTIQFDVYLCAYVCCMNDGGGGGSVHSCVCPDWLEVVCIGRISYTFQIKIMSATKLWWCVWEINQTSPKNFHMPQRCDGLERA